MLLPFVIVIANNTVCVAAVPINNIFLLEVEIIDCNFIRVS